jgi:hypothetical protein
MISRSLPLTNFAHLPVHEEQHEIRDLRGELKWEGNLDEQRKSRFTAK